MNATQELELIVDFAKLLRKHGPDSFDALAKALSSPEGLQTVLTILKKSVEVARRAGGNVSTPALKDSALASLLEDLKEKDRPRYELLASLYRELASRTLLPSLKGLKDAIVALGLPATDHASRQKLVCKLVMHLAGLPVEELSEAARRVRAKGQPDRSLAAWSEIILKR